MRRTAPILVVLITTFLAGFAFMLVEFQLIFHFLAPMLIRAGATRAAIWTLLLPLCLLATRRIGGGRGWLFNAAAMTSICFAAAVVAELTYLTHVAGHDGLRRPMDRQAFPPSAIIHFALTSVHPPFVLMLASTMLLTFLGARAEEREGEISMNRLEARLSEARLNLLRSQLHPPFLFKSLNSVLALIRHDGSRAKEMLARLSQFYAITTATEGRHLIPVDEELRYVRQYADIERIRFGERLSIDIAADPRALRGEVPALLLQPLVENAIKHGVARTSGPGWVHVYVLAAAAQLHLTVEDNGCWLESNERGVGLANTHSRLEQLYGSDYAFAIEPIDRAGSRVRLTIPYRACEARVA